MKTITPNEVKALIRATKPTAVRDRALLDLLFHSGLRCAEALDLRASDVESDRLTVRCGKGRKSRTIALATSYGHWELWLAKRGASGDDFIFATRTGERLATSHVRRLLKTLGERAGVETHAHAFRHGHACQVFDETKDVSLVSRQLGHARIATTSIYLQGLGVDLDRVSSLKF
ncbi:tyrosine-type recombinase/integrase [Lacipirellula parvula]|uniref:Tyr recombinase domain-containing protein n=1 Tax=Lacipirellula parvula TaxID=2650471 RepID=A0A5K7XK74_9BACT|nr:tyrosine-type recombinase/integrase [Lacipirellula parvula]BBO35531.1 hypothetical protein PLANPX_5143 [Lacipirellula parvula]